MEPALLDEAMGDGPTLLPGMMAHELPSTKKAEASLGYIVRYKHPLRNQTASYYHLGCPEVACHGKGASDNWTGSNADVIGPYRGCGSRRC